MIKTLQRYGMFGTLQWVVPNAEVALSRIAFFFSFFIITKRVREESSMSPQ